MYINKIPHKYIDWHLLQEYLIGKEKENIHTYVYNFQFFVSIVIFFKKKLHARRYHSESGWQTLMEIIVEHYGLEVDQSAITIFICLVPVVIDACVKLWVCSTLNLSCPENKCGLFSTLLLCKTEVDVGYGNLLTWFSKMHFILILYSLIFRLD